jgi:hypothetical protein
LKAKVSLLDRERLFYSKGDELPNHKKQRSLLTLELSRLRVGEVSFKAEVT